MRIVQWAGLVVLPVVGLIALQTYLVFREPIFSPVDELQHTDYVRVIAEQGHLPIYGKANIDPTLLAVYMHEYPGQFSPDGYNIPDYIFINYETVQFPAYYVLAAPLYRIFDRDPRVAIYALRLENVAFSGAALLVLILLMRRVLPTRQELSALASVVILAMPGFAMRHSQVTNEVLATLLLTVFFASLLRQSDAHPRWAAFGEGALLGAAVLTKLTAAGVGASALAAWATRPGGLRLRVLPAAAGFALAVTPWLAWSLSVYRSPLPWTTTHVQLTFCPCPLPNSASAWQLFLHDIWVSFVLPIEWAGPGYQRSQLMRIGAWAFVLLIAASLGWSLYAMRSRGNANRRMALLAVLALLGVAAGILGLDVSLNRFTSTDLRELYLFAAPMVLLLGGLMAGLDRRLGWVVLGGLLAIWLLIDLQLYSGTQCQGCPPRSDWRVAGSGPQPVRGSPYLGRASLYVGQAYEAAH
jgi:hypothetical protein